jgi:hypothetical protein
MSIEERKLLLTVGRIVGRVQVDRDPSGAVAKPATMALDHRIRKRFAEPVQFAPINAVLET